MFLMCVLHLEREVCWKERKCIWLVIFEFVACSVTSGNKSGVIVDRSFKIHVVDLLLLEDTCLNICDRLDVFNLQLEAFAKGCGAGAPGHSYCSMPSLDKGFWVPKLLLKVE